MGWITDRGPKFHEGYVLPEFADGVRGKGVWTGKVPDNEVIVEIEYIGRPGSITDERYVTRPAGQVIGWRVCCDCTDGWMSDLVERVPSPTLEDHSAGRIYVVDEDMIGVDDMFDDMFRGIWRREHVDGFDALGAIADARQAISAAERQLDDAVAAARRAGVSWGAVAAAAGMSSRQGAHRRWGKEGDDLP